MTLQQIFDYISNNTEKLSTVRRSANQVLHGVRRASDVFESAYECICFNEILSNSLGSRDLSIVAVGDLTSQGVLRLANTNEFEYVQ